MDEFVKMCSDSIYYDLRENQGCSESQIEEINNILGEFGYHIPASIKQELLYAGIFINNGRGIYLEIIETIKYYQDFKQDISQGYWNMSDGGFGVFLRSDSPLKEYVTNSFLTEEDVFENPAFCHKTGDLLDDDISIHVYYQRYSDKVISVQKKILDKYNLFYERNPHAYKFKQAMVEVYSLIENLIKNIDDNDEIDLYKRIIQELRIGAGRLLFNRKSTVLYEDMLSKLDKGNRYDYNSRVMTLLVSRSSVFKELYIELVSTWESMKAR